MGEKKKKEKKDKEKKKKEKKEKATVRSAPDGSDKQFCYSYNTQVKVVLSSHSSFYTGQKAHLVKRGEGSFTLKSGEKETLSMEVSPESYMDKVTQITPFQDAFPAYSARWLTCA